MQTPVSLGGATGGRGFSVAAAGVLQKSRHLELTTFHLKDRGHMSNVIKEAKEGKLFCHQRKHVAVDGPCLKH